MEIVKQSDFTPGGATYKETIDEIKDNFISVEQVSTNSEPDSVPKSLGDGTIVQKGYDSALGVFVEQEDIVSGGSYVEGKYYYYPSDGKVYKALFTGTWTDLGGIDSNWVEKSVQSQSNSTLLFDGDGVDVRDYSLTEEYSNFQLISLYFGEVNDGQVVTMSTDLITSSNYFDITAEDTAGGSNIETTLNTTVINFPNSTTITLVAGYNNGAKVSSIVFHSLRKIVGILRK